VDLRKGKHIIAFMSLTCPHCKKAAYLLQIIYHEHPELPIYMVLQGPEQLKQKFFDETHAEHVPYILFGHTDDFMNMAGTSVPSILWVNNGVPEYKSVYAYYQLDPKFMEEWVKKP
jgi:glutaredoxin